MHTSVQAHDSGTSFAIRTAIRTEQARLGMTRIRTLTAWANSATASFAVLLVPVLSFVVLSAMWVSAPLAQAQGPVATSPSIPANNSPPSQGKPASAAKPSAAGTPSTAARMPAPESKPTWQELTPAQQASLKPLAANWSAIGEGQKRKWLALSKNYPALPAAEQAKLHSRMTEWASLSQQQRAQARLNFAETKTLSPGEKTANWQAYQALSPEDRERLAANATPKPAGAAAAVKPVAPQKLAAVPVTRQDSKRDAEGVLGTPMPPGSQAVDRNTLLPRLSSATEPAVRKN